jgi:Protein of unknown function (DUF2563)
MASDAGKLLVEPAGLMSGAVSSRQAADHAHDGAAHLSGRSVGSNMFGGFPTASAFAEAVRASHAEHIEILKAHGESLTTLGGNADTVAAAFTEFDHNSAAALEAIRCNYAT